MKSIVRRHQWLLLLVIFTLAAVSCAAKTAAPVAPPNSNDATTDAEMLETVKLPESIAAPVPSAPAASGAVAAVPPPTSWPSGSPITVIQNYESEIRQLVSKYDAQRSDVKVMAERDRVLGQRVRKFFDFQELARLSLSAHWSGLSVAQRSRFTDTFVKLIERSYLSKSREMIADYAVVYDNQEVNGTRARVTSTIKKADVDVKVAYELKRRDGTDANAWMIYNVIFDNLDLLGNYRSQFNRIISQKSFRELLRIMEDRVKNPADTA